MHKAIFSEKERQLIIDFIYDGVVGEGFRVLKHRVQSRKYSAIITDYHLMMKFKASLDKHIKR